MKKVLSLVIGFLILGTISLFADATATFVALETQVAQIVQTQQAGSLTATLTINATATWVVSSYTATKTPTLPPATATQIALSFTPTVTSVANSAVIVPTTITGGQSVASVVLTITIGGTFTKGQIWIYKPSNIQTTFKQTKVGGTPSNTKGGYIMTYAGTGQAGAVVANGGNAIKITISASASDTISVTWYNLIYPTITQSLTWAMKEHNYTESGVVYQHIASASLPTQSVVSPSGAVALTSQNPTYAATPAVINAFTWIEHITSGFVGGSLAVMLPDSYWSQWNINAAATATPGYVSVTGLLIGTPVVNPGFNQLFIPVPTAATNAAWTFVYTGKPAIAENKAMFGLVGNAISMTLTAETPIQFGPVFNVAIATITPIATTVPFNISFTFYAATGTNDYYFVVTPSAGDKVIVDNIYLSTTGTAGTIQVQGGTNSVVAYAPLIISSSNQTQTITGVGTKYGTNELIVIHAISVSRNALIQGLLRWHQSPF